MRLLLIFWRSFQLKLIVEPGSDKSILAEADENLKQFSRYIPLYPKRAKKKNLQSHLTYCQNVATVIAWISNGMIQNERRQNMKKKNISHKSQTDWDRVDKLRDRDIDFSDNPEITDEMFAKAVLRKGLKPVVRKTQVTLRVDDDVLKWFKEQGKGYQTRINSLLKAYKEAHQNESDRTSA